MSDTAADLARYFTGPLCPRCGFTQFAVGEVVCQGCGGSDWNPGLHTRCPETRVEGLEFINGMWWLANKDPGLLDGVGIRDAHAADLLVASIIKSGKPFICNQDAPGEGKWMVSVSGYTGCAPTLAEAVAIARHRAADAEEQG